MDIKDILRFDQGKREEERNNNALRDCDIRFTAKEGGIWLLIGIQPHMQHFSFASRLMGIETQK